MNDFTKKVAGKSTFNIGFISVLLSIFFPHSNIFYPITGVIAIVYFFGGGYFFKGYYPEGKPMFLYFLGFLYSGIFLGSAFSSPKFSLASELLRAPVIWSAALLVVVVIPVLLKKEKFQKGLNHFFIDGIILLVFSIIQGIIQKG